MKLFEPGKIGRLTLKNRIIMAPMGIGVLIEPEGWFSQRAIDHYITRAKGGTGLIMTNMVRISREIEPPISQALGQRLYADTPEHRDKFSAFAEDIHRYGAKIALQLTPGYGRIASAKQLKAYGAVAPSAQPCLEDPSVMARALTTDEIQRLVQSSEHVAGMLRDAGIDAVELHAHGGYLFDQFMTPLWNERTDRYGGDLDNRLRFVTEVIQAIRSGAGSDFPIICRYSLTHYYEGGRQIDEGLEIARKLEAAGVDALDIDAGCHETFYWLIPPTALPMGCTLNLAEMVKRVVKIPVIAGGKLGLPQLAEKALQRGKADFISLGRSLLADPEWPDKVKEGRLDDIRPCIGDLEGCHDRLHEGKDICCTVNRQCANEKESVIHPAEKKKSLLVIGGGPGGMEAARVAALRGHKVALWEKGYALGGNLRLASVPDFKQEYRTLIKYLSTQIRKLGVTVELGKEATLEQIQRLHPDAVILATGGMLVYPEIPGRDRDKVTASLDISSLLKGLLPWSAVRKKKGLQKIIWFGGNIFGRYLNPSAIARMAKIWLPFGKTVIIIGGSYHGCEMALFLTKNGRKVTIVEASDRFLHGLDEPLNRALLEKLLSDANVKIMTNTKVTEVTDTGVTIADKNGNKAILKSDSIMFSVEVRPDERLSNLLMGKATEVHAIGDCVEPGRAINTIWKGFDTTRLI